MAGLLSSFFGGDSSSLGGGQDDLQSGNLFSLIQDPNKRRLLSDLLLKFGGGQQENLDSQQQGQGFFNTGGIPFDQINKRNINF